MEVIAGQNTAIAIRGIVLPRNTRTSTHTPPPTIDRCLGRLVRRQVFSGGRRRSVWSCSIMRPFEYFLAVEFPRVA